MKKTFVLLFAMGLIGNVDAQSLTPTVVASAGETFQSSSIQLDWTIGEVAISTIQNSSLMVTQGFHQPNYTITSMNELPLEIGSVVVFPNPTSDRIDMELEFEESRNVQIVLFDLNGKVIWTKESNAAQIQETTDISHLPSGNYFLNFLIDDSKFSSSIKIQKIN